MLITAPKVPESVIERIASAVSGFDVDVAHWRDEECERPIPRHVLLAELSVDGVDGMFVTLNDAIDSEVIDAAGDTLRCISTMSVGFNHVSTDVCRERGIQVGFTPDVLTDTTADLCVALLLATARRLPESAAAAKAGLWGDWRAGWLLGKEVSGSTIGVVGLGRIGTAFSRRMKGFGCRILYCGRREKPELAAELGGAEYVSFDDLLARSDFVVPHCPLSAETTNLFDREAFAKMKPGAMFINTTRGGVVDQEALLEALTDANSPLAAAGMDVTSPEPLPPTHPLMALDNCLILPHIGSSTESTRHAMAMLAADNLAAGIAGRPLKQCVHR